jgi:hypothetical protein
MRPVFFKKSLAFGRKFFGINMIGAGALIALLSAGQPALANAHDGPMLGEPIPVRNEDEEDAKFAKRVAELEKSLNEFLTIDEDKKVHVKKEYQEGLPMPAQQVERMLQMMVRVSDD